MEAEQNMSALRPPPNQGSLLAPADALPATRTHAGRATDGKLAQLRDDTEHGRTYLDIDGRVSVLLLGLSVLGRPRFVVGHVVCDCMRVDGRWGLRFCEWFAGKERRRPRCQTPSQPRRQTSKLRNSPLPEPLCTTSAVDGHPWPTGRSRVGSRVGHGLVELHG